MVMYIWSGGPLMKNLDAPEIKQLVRVMLSSILYEKQLNS
jgi:hypothetical protein